MAELSFKEKITAEILQDRIDMLSLNNGEKSDAPSAFTRASNILSLLVEAIKKCELTDEQIDSCWSDDTINEKTGGYDPEKVCKNVEQTFRQKLINIIEKPIRKPV